MGPVLNLLHFALDDADQAVEVGGGEVGDGPLEQRPDPFGRIEVRRVRGQPVDPQPGFVLRGEVRQLRGQVDVKSARSAVLAFRPARFSGPLPAPGVPLSRHRALRKPLRAVMVLILCLAREKGCASPGSGSA
jgi:hypothetical protein